MELCPVSGGTALTVEIEPPRASTSCSLNAGGIECSTVPYLGADLSWVLVGLLVWEDENDHSAVRTPAVIPYLPGMLP